MNSGQYEMTVCVGGRPIREYGHRGLTYVEGRKKQPYTLKFRNNSAQRVLAVLSVDGLSVVDGQPADSTSDGYVIPAYQQVEIRGWRTSLDEVHDFVFEPPAAAYSTQMQKDDSNCGVVSVKVFSEKFNETEMNKLLREIAEEQKQQRYWRGPVITPHMVPVYPMWGGTTTCAAEPTYGCALNHEALKANITCCGVGSASNAGAGFVPGNIALNAVFTSAKAPAQEVPDFNLGTGWGTSRVDQVTETKFERCLELASFSIYYSDDTGLKAAGVEVDKKLAVATRSLPRGFNGFCKPPVVTSS